MTTAPAPRVLVIGLDAGDANLIQQWAHEGHLPVLQQLMQEGAWGRLKTTTDLGHTSVWPSIFTGTSPGDHGIYSVIQSVPGSYDILPVWANQRRQPNFWQYLDRNGTKCVIFDAPFDCPIEGFKGIQILEWGSWIRFWEQEGFPRRTWKQLRDRLPLPPIQPGTIVYRQNPSQLRQLYDWLTIGIGLKARAVKWLMTQEPWDVFVTVFREPHPAGHYFWRLDASHRANSTNSHQNFLRNVYTALDQALGEILSGLNDQVTVFIVSGDGMGPNYSGWHLLPDVLRKLGFLIVNCGTFQEGSGGAVWNPDGFLSAIRKMVPADLRMKISGLLPDPVRFRLRRRWSALPIDWDRSRAYYIPNECEGQIRINLHGREPSGCVKDCIEYDGLCQELSEQLTELVNPQTGQKAVRAVVRTDAVCGSRKNGLPDLMVLWDEKAKVTTELYSEKCGRISKSFSACDLSPYYVGNHRAPGFAIIKGTRMPKGPVLEGRHILDLSPTFLDLFGISQPSPMSGEAWTDLWNGT